MRRNQELKYAFIAPSVVWILVFSLFPLASALYYSFHTYVLGRGITAFVAFQNYLENLRNPTFWHSAGITVAYVVIAVSAEMVFGDGDGVVFGRFTASLDVIGHELTHGVTENTAGVMTSLIWVRSTSTTWKPERSRSPAEVATSLPIGSVGT